VIRCAAALADGTDTTKVTDQALSRMAEDLADVRPDLFLLFASPHHADELEGILDAVRSEFDPACVIGCSGEGLIGEDREVEGKSALSMFAASLPGVTLSPFHVTFQAQGEGGSFSGLPLSVLQESTDAAVILFADPFSFPLGDLLRVANREASGVPFVGGVASGAMFAGQNRLILNDQVLSEGAVGLAMNGNVMLRTVVSQGCRPVGKPFIVTDGDENVIRSLGGVNPIECLREVIQELPESERDLLRRALHVGRAIDVTKSTFDRGDFLVRSVVALDQDTGSLSINDMVRKGQTVQFLIRDPGSASEDLRELLDGSVEFFKHHPPKGALLFSCNGRGTRMFGTPNHDVTAVHERVADLPIAGFFAAGEVGPVGGQNFLHGFTASIALICQRQDDN